MANDSVLHPNSKMTLVEGHATLVALKNDIKKGTEILYNYSDSNKCMAWRKLKKVQI